MAKVTVSSVTFDPAPCTGCTQSVPTTSEKVHAPRSCGFAPLTARSRREYRDELLLTNITCLFVSAKLRHSNKNRSNNHCELNYCVAVEFVQGLREILWNAIMFLWLSLQGVCTLTLIDV